MKKRLEKLSDKTDGCELTIISQAIEYMESGIEPDDIYVNEDERFGYPCALAEKDIMNPQSWPDDWNYEPSTADFTNLEDWVKRIEDEF